MTKLTYLAAGLFVGLFLLPRTMGIPGFDALLTKVLGPVSAVNMTIALLISILLVSFILLAVFKQPNQNYEETIK